MRRIRIDIEYDGSAYCGWQRQTNGLSIQEVLETVLHRVTGEAHVIQGSGRTDAGVHALCQVAHFDTVSRIPADRFAFALNYYLPPDIRILASCEVPSTFHARFDATAKTYRYVYRNHPQQSALFRNLCAHHAQPLNVKAMQDGAAFLIGEHDFSSFCTHADGKNTVRRIDRIDVFRENSYVIIEITGSGFLHNMVRIIAGTLAQIGNGKMAPEEISGILQACDRNAAGPTAPAQGLLLKKVYYGEIQQRPNTNA